MRALVVTALLVVSTSAYADGNVELAGGISIPAGDNNWKNIAGTSGKLGVRLGEMVGDLGGMLQVDWTPVNVNNGGGSFGNIASTSFSAHVFRVLANFAFQHHVLEHVVIGARAGIGIDIAHESVSGSLGTATASRSDTDVGLAVELGGGVWYDFGGTQVGGELAVPIGNHNSPSQNGSIPFQYALEDVDLLAVVRFRNF